MLSKRLIPCLDLKDGRVVKGVNFVHLVDAGDPVETAKLYNAFGADELVFLDITASYRGNTPMWEIISRATIGDPTAVYTVFPPFVSTVSSTTLDVATVTMTFPPLFLESSFLARRARERSPLTNLPSDVTKTHLSASPSWAIPRSAPVSTTSLFRFSRFSSVGSLGWPGNSPCGLP